MQQNMGIGMTIQIKWVTPGFHCGGHSSKKTDRYPGASLLKERKWVENLTLFVWPVAYAGGVMEQMLPFCPRVLAAKY